MARPFDFSRPASGAAKQQFHNAARRQLRALAAELVLPAGSFDLRSNKGGPAVSGEATLHGEHAMDQLLQTLSRMGGKALPETDGYSNRFQIASASSNRVYVVAQRKISGQWACSCPGSIYRKDKTCKHLRALGLAS